MSKRESNNFYNLLYGRLYSLLIYFGYIERKFTMFLNLANRDSNLDMYYRGLQAQRVRLKKDFDIADDISINESWDFLEKTIVAIESTIESKSLYESVSKSLKLYDIIESPLGRYFQLALESENEVAKHEYNILKFFFNIEETNYISIPLIGFTRLEGVVHIIYQVNDKPISVSTIANVMRSFTIEYESMLIDIFASKEIREAISDVELLMLNKEEFEAKSSPILKQLNYIKYYIETKEYLTYKLNKLEKDEDVEIVTYWDLPIDLRTSFQQLLNFFDDFVENYYGEKILLKVEKVPSGLKLVLSKNSSDLSKINFYLSDFFNFFIEPDIDLINLNKSQIIENHSSNVKYLLKIINLEKKALQLKLRYYLDKSKTLSRNIEEKNLIIDSQNLAIRFFESQQVKLLKLIHHQNERKLSFEKEMNIQRVEFVKSVRELLSKNKFLDAIKYSKNTLGPKHDSILNDLIFFESKLRRIKKDRRNGVLTIKDYDQLYSRLISEFLDFLNEIE